MVKRGVFKKLAALTATVVMISAFAASASAVVTVTTTTQYETNKDKVNVVANVSGLGGAVEVTYYATNGDTKVYVDQKTAESDGTATFDYVTAATNIDSTAVKVGSKDNNTADGDVPGYTISGAGITTVTVPTKDINGAQYLTYNLDDSKFIKKVTATGATVSSYEYADNTLTVVLAGAKGNVVLTVETADKATYNPTGKVVYAGGIVSDGTNDKVLEGDELVEGDAGIAAAEGNRKVTVIGQVTVAEEYGVIISENDITIGEVTELSGTAYEAKGRNENGYFAVQVIDNGEGANALFESGAQYNTAIYYKNDMTGKYHVVAGDVVTVVDLTE